MSIRERHKDIRVEIETRYYEAGTGLPQGESTELLPGTSGTETTASKVVTIEALSAVMKASADGQQIEAIAPLRLPGCIDEVWIDYSHTNERFEYNGIQTDQILFDDLLDGHDATKAISITIIVNVSENV